jgi:hypothetical protein
MILQLVRPSAYDQEKPGRTIGHPAGWHSGMLARIQKAVLASSPDSQPAY